LVVTAIQLCRANGGEIGITAEKTRTAVVVAICAFHFSVDWIEVTRQADYA